MKPVAAILSSFLAVVLTACGGSSTSPTPIGISGSWLADLQDQNGNHVLVFNADLAQASGSALSIHNFSFSNPSPCFEATTTQSATFTASGSSGAYQTGLFNMTITSTSNAGENVATLTGTRLGDGRISGNWTLSGSAGCSSNGSFLMSLPQ
jgi:hypothetical protein